MLDFLEDARRSGVLGQGLVEFHVAHAAGFAEAVEQARAATGRPGPPEAFIDLGTGGGIPGLVLAARWPQATAVLLDASEARIEHLRPLLSSLGWAARIRALRARAEVAGRDPELRGRFPVVVARGFGAPAVLAECAAPLLDLGGLLVVSEPPFTPTGPGHPAGPGTPVPAPDPGAPGSGGPTWGAGAWDHARWPLEGPGQLGLEPLRWYRHRFGYQILRVASACPDRFPRREGVPAKRPLWR